MIAINTFQNYSTRENVITNTTLLMVRHLHRQRPDLFENFLNVRLVENGPTIGPRFLSKSAKAVNAGPKPRHSPE